MNNFLSINYICIACKSQWFSRTPDQSLELFPQKDLLWEIHTVH